MKRRKVFSKNPLVWFHYVLLTGVLYLAFYTGDFLFPTKFQSLWLMGLWFFLFLGVGDQLIHYLLKVD